MKLYTIEVWEKGDTLPKRFVHPSAVEVYRIAGRYIKELWDQAKMNGMPQDLIEVMKLLGGLIEFDEVEVPDYGILRHSQMTNIIGVLRSAIDELSGKDEDAQYYRDMADLLEAIETLQGAIK